MQPKLETFKTSHFTTDNKTYSWFKCIPILNYYIHCRD